MYSCAHALISTKLDNVNCLKQFDALRTGPQGQNKEKKKRQRKEKEDKTEISTSSGGTRNPQKHHLGPQMRCCMAFSDSEAFSRPRWLPQLGHEPRVITTGSEHSPPL
jgi:hypothetical protein